MTRRSPNGVDHDVPMNGPCATCGRGRHEDWPAPLTCDMEADCTEPVTMVDSSGFAYCTDHGMTRRYYEPCRKLRPHELRRLQRGQQIERY